MSLSVPSQVSLVSTRLTINHEAFCERPMAWSQPHCFLRKRCRSITEMFGRNDPLDSLVIDHDDWRVQLSPLCTSDLPYRNASFWRVNLINMKHIAKNLFNEEQPYLIFDSVCYRSLRRLQRMCWMDISLFLSPIHFASWWLLYMALLINHCIW